MANKTVRTKKASTATSPTTATAITDTTDTTDTTQEDSITIIKQASCSNLQQTATLQYLIGQEDTSALFWKIQANSGNGMFSAEWVAFTAIQQALDDWPKALPITSMTLRSLYQGKSVNTPSFLLASLVAEGILQQVPEKKRHFQVGDVDGFLSAVASSDPAHSNPRKPKGKVKAKAGGRMTKAAAKPVKAK